MGVHSAPENTLRYRDRMPSFAAAVAIVAIVALCLWLFFRRGSINHRADVDMPIGDQPSTTSADGSRDEPDRPAT